MVLHIAASIITPVMCTTKCSHILMTVLAQSKAHAYWGFTLPLMEAVRNLSNHGRNCSVALLRYTMRVHWENAPITCFVSLTSLSSSLAYILIIVPKRKKTFV